VAGECIVVKRLVVATTTIEITANTKAR
jgi:hypothetical protein